MADPEAPVLSYFDCLLRRQDVALLQGPHWLNDQLIGFFFEYLAREACAQPGLLLLDGSATFLLANLGADGRAAVLEPRGFGSTTSLALFAVNDNPEVEAAGGGSHWSLLAWDAPSGPLYHYDSAGGINSGAARRVHAAAAPPGSRLVEARAPQQANGYDCGLHVLALARLLCERHAAAAAGGPPMSFEVRPSEATPAHAAALRLELSDLISSKAAAAASRAAGGAAAPGGS